MNKVLADMIRPDDKSELVLENWYRLQIYSSIEILLSDKIPLLLRSWLEILLYA